MLKFRQFKLGRYAKTLVYKVQVGMCRLEPSNILPNSAKIVGVVPTWHVRHMNILINYPMVFT